MTRKSVFTLIAAALAAAILLAACGGSSHSEGSTEAGSTASSAQSSGEGGDAVSIRDFAYSPPNLTVSEGTTVTFTNQDSTEHTATGSGGAFDTGSIGKGQAKSVTLQKAGTFSYVCTFHPFMHGTVTVK
jgi:plastocyanin